MLLGLLPTDVSFSILKISGITYSIISTKLSNSLFDLKLNVNISAINSRIIGAHSRIYTLWISTVQYRPAPDHFRKLYFWRVWFDSNRREMLELFVFTMLLAPNQRSNSILPLCGNKSDDSKGLVAHFSRYITEHFLH